MQTVSDRNSLTRGFVVYCSSELIMSGRASGRGPEGTGNCAQAVSYAVQVDLPAPGRGLRQAAGSDRPGSRRIGPALWRQLEDSMMPGMITSDAGRALNEECNQ